MNNLSDAWYPPIKRFLQITASDDAPLFSGIICFVVFFVLLLGFSMSFQYRNTVKRISLQGNEIELFLESEAPYFSKYLNDVVYLFEKIDADVIVYEDISEYFTSQIFQNLLIINGLVNKKRNTPLRFIYLLSEDIVAPNIRRKFFDYSFPFIKYDVYEALIKVMKEDNIYSFFVGEENFLKKVSTHFNSIWLLSDVCNDFVLWPKPADKKPASYYTKHFAMFIYKHLFPSDYTNLQNRKGFVYTLMGRNGGIAQSEILRIDAEIESLNAIMSCAKNESCKSIEELDILHKYKIEQCDNKAYSIEARAVEIKKLDDEMEQRKKHVENNNKKRIKDLSKGIRTLEKERTEIQTSICANSKVVLTDRQMDAIFEIAHREIAGATDFDIKSGSQCDLMKYLFREGYIDEKYEEFMVFL